MIAAVANERRSIMLFDTHWQLIESVQCATDAQFLNESIYDLVQEYGKGLGGTMLIPLSVRAEYNATNAWLVTE